MRYLFIIIALFCVSFFFGCKDKEDVLRFGIDTAYRPFSYMQNGELKGFDLDLIELIAKELNIKTEIHQMQFLNLIPALQHKSIDLITNQEIFPSRKESFDFSDSYHLHHWVIVFRKNFPIKNKEELNNKKIAYIVGDMVDKWLVQNTRNVKLISVDDDPISIELLKIGRIDGFIAFKESAIIYCENNPTIGFADLKIKEIGVGIAMRKNSTLLPQINQALENLEKSGEIQKLKEKWFNNQNY